MLQGQLKAASAEIAALSTQKADAAQAIAQSCTDLDVSRGALVLSRAECEEKGTLIKSCEADVHARGVAAVIRPCLDECRCCSSRRRRSRLEYKSVCSCLLVNSLQQKVWLTKKWLSSRVCGVHSGMQIDSKRLGYRQGAMAAAFGCKQYSSDVTRLGGFFEAM